MQSNVLFAATLLALGAFAAGAAAAEPAEGKTRMAWAQLDANGDGVIDRDEAARFPHLARKFDRLDANGDGRLDASEMPRHRGAGGRGHHGGFGFGRGGIDGIARLDADGDGRISRAELEQAAAARQRGPRGGRHGLLEHFDAIDANGDGYIVRSELRAWHERQRPVREAEMRKRFDERFDAADLNGDGKLSRVEVEEKMPHLARSFAWMDENRDGFLSREELRPQRVR